MRMRIGAWALIAIGLVLTIGWCVRLVPALFIAEAGRGLNFAEGALIAGPLAVGAASLFAGWRLWRRHDPAAVRGWPRLVVTAAVGLGLLAALVGVLMILRLG